MKKNDTFEKRFFSWNGWDQLDVNCMSFYECEFVTDFGPIKKGDKFDNVVLAYDLGVLQAYNNDGDLLHEVPFTLVPVES